MSLRVCASFKRPFIVKLLHFSLVFAPGLLSSIGSSIQLLLVFIFHFGSLTAFLLCFAVLRCGVVCTAYKQHLISHAITRKTRLKESSIE